MGLGSAYRHYHFENPSIESFKRSASSSFSDFFGNLFGQTCQSYPSNVSIINSTQLDWALLLLLFFCICVCYIQFSFDPARMSSINDSTDDHCLLIGFSPPLFKWKGWVKGSRRTYLSGYITTLRLGPEGRCVLVPKERKSCWIDWPMKFNSHSVGQVTDWTSQSCCRCCWLS